MLSFKIDKYSANNNGITESHRQIFVSPELTNVNKVQLLQFPNGVVRIPTTDSDHFIIKRNGVKGNFEVKVSNIYHFLQFKYYFNKFIVVRKSFRISNLCSD